MNYACLKNLFILFCFFFIVMETMGNNVKDLLQFPEVGFTICLVSDKALSTRVMWPYPYSIRAFFYTLRYGGGLFDPPPD